MVKKFKKDKIYYYKHKSREDLVFKNTNIEDGYGYPDLKNYFWINNTNNKKSGYILDDESTRIRCSEISEKYCKLLFNIEF